MNELKSHSLWVEKYRPQTIEDCILPNRIKDFFQNQIDKGELQNILLIGSPGTGKCLDPNEEIEVLVSNKIYKELLNFIELD